MRGSHEDNDCSKGCENCEENKAQTVKYLQYIGNYHFLINCDTCVGLFICMFFFFRLSVSFSLSDFCWFICLFIYHDIGKACDEDLSPLQCKLLVALNSRCIMCVCVQHFFYFLHVHFLVQFLLVCFFVCLSLQFYDSIGEVCCEDLSPLQQTSSHPPLQMCVCLLFLSILCFKQYYWFVYLSRRYLSPLQQTSSHPPLQRTRLRHASYP